MEDIFWPKVCNKTSLINFIVQKWMKPEYRAKLQEKILYATVNETCYRMTRQDSEEVSAFQCQQEVAYFSMLPMLQEMSSIMSSAFWQN